MGKPIVEGTRITVELILEKLSSGESVEQIVDAHPRLSREGVVAAALFLSSDPWLRRLPPVQVTGKPRSLLPRLLMRSATNARACGE